MTGIDTNILTRYVVKDDPEQTLAAEALIDDAANIASPLHVSVIVLCELSWVLRRVYKFSKPDLIRVVFDLLAAAELHFHQRDEVSKALEMYGCVKAGLADCLIAQISVSHGITTTFTFDLAASALDGFKLLVPKSP